MTDQNHTEPSLDFAAAVGAAVASMTERQENLLAYRERLVASGQLKSVLMAELRCQRNCVLLQVFQTKQGPALYHPRFKLSARLNEQITSESARAAHTVDGDRHWDSRADSFELMQSVGAATGELTKVRCDHVQGFMVDLAAMEIGAPGKPVRRVAR